MKTVYFLLTISLSLFSFTATNKVLLEDTPSMVQTINLVYEGNATCVAIDKKGKINTSQLSKELLAAFENSHLVTYNDDLYIFSTTEEIDMFVDQLEKEYQTNRLNQTKAIADEGVVQFTVFEHSFYAGDSLSRTGNFSVPDLKPFGFNDNISSALISNRSDRFYLIQFFEHKNYKGIGRSSILGPGKTFKKERFFNADNGLNDEISSMKGRYL